MSQDLAEKRCVPCSGGQPPLAEQTVSDLAQQLGSGWRVVDGHHLEKEYRFRDFREALDFANRAGAVAEHQRHHPDIHLAYGKVRLQVWTHAADGLTENDFILAARIDRDAA